MLTYWRRAGRAGHWPKPTLDVTNCSPSRWRCRVVNISLADIVTCEEYSDYVPPSSAAETLGKRCTVEHESSESNAASDRHDTRSELETAVKEDQFFLVYQPEIDLHTNAFVGVEALLRWRHPERGVENPESFLAALESSGLILPVGQWALSTACAQGAEWHDKGYRFSVSVNISYRQIESSEFVAQVDQILTSSRFPRSLLVLEFAQSILSGTLEPQLRALKELGLRLAVDDFAPGTSQLSDLAGSPIDIVKLERQFIASMSASTTAVAQVHELVDLSKKMNLQIVASGIEDAEQRQRLQLQDVAVGQGFHFSKPHEAQEIDHYLEDFSIFSGKPL
jgi:EAL domain-containing protein (putative c-di-GMP-specific phosphodiesterase class I)